MGTQVSRSKFVAQLADEIVHKAENVLDGEIVHVKEGAKMLRSLVKSRPLTVVGAAIGLGVIVGVVIALGRR